MRFMWILVYPHIWGGWDECKVFVRYEDMRAFMKNRHLEHWEVRYFKRKIPS